MERHTAGRGRRRLEDEDEEMLAVWSSAASRLALALWGLARQRAKARSAGRDVNSIQISIPLSKGESKERGGSWTLLRAMNLVRHRSTALYTSEVCTLRALVIDVTGWERPGPGRLYQTSRNDSKHPVSRRWMLLISRTQWSNNAIAQDIHAMSADAMSRLMCRICRMTYA